MMLILYSNLIVRLSSSLTWTSLIFLLQKPKICCFIFIHSFSKEKPLQPNIHFALSPICSSWIVDLYLFDCVLLQVVRSRRRWHLANGARWRVCWSIVSDSGGVRYTSVIMVLIANLILMPLICTSPETEETFQTSLLSTCRQIRARFIVCSLACLERCERGGKDSGLTGPAPR